MLNMSQVNQESPRIVEVILPLPPMSLNPFMRMHWAAREKLLKSYRKTVADHFIGVEPFLKVHTEYEWTIFGSELVFLNRDASNVSAVGEKVISDVLVNSKIFKDDSTRYIQNPILHWCFNDKVKDPEIYGSGEVLVRLSDVPVYKGELIRLEN